MGHLSLGLGVEGEESFLLLAIEHKAVVIITFVVSGEFDVGDEEVVIFVLDERASTCSSLVLNHSFARPYLTGITNNQYNNKSQISPATQLSSSSTLREITLSIFQLPHPSAAATTSDKLNQRQSDPIVIRDFFL